MSHQTSKPEDSGVIPDNVEIKLLSGTKARENLLVMLLGNKSDPVVLEYLMPKFLKVTNRGTAKPISQLMFSPSGCFVALLCFFFYLCRVFIVLDEDGHSFRTLTLTLDRKEGRQEMEWWRIMENTTDPDYVQILSHIPYADPDSILLYTFNDKIFPANLNILTAGG